MRDKEILLANLGAKIREVRSRTELTQEDVAYKSGLSRSYYSGIERGVRNVSAINLITIALVLNVEVGELFPTKFTFE